VAASPSSRTPSKNNYSSVQFLDGRAAVSCRLDYTSSQRRRDFFVIRPSNLDGRRKRKSPIRPIRRTWSHFLEMGRRRDCFVIRSYYSSHMVGRWQSVPFGSFCHCWHNNFLSCAILIMTVQNFGWRVSGVMGEADRPNLRYYCEWDSDLIFHDLCKTIITLTLNPRALALLAYFEYRTAGRLLRYRSRGQTWREEIHFEPLDFGLLYSFLFNTRWTDA